MPGKRGSRSPTPVRRPGYAESPAAPLGRRGAHTRDLIKARASALFIADGYHSTSVDAIAKALGGSRATVYQYFRSKEEIYAELVRDCEHAVVAHAHTLGPLGPGAGGLEAMRRWLHEWADIYDTYAAVFLEFPGIGTIESIPVPDAAHVIAEFRSIITGKLAAAAVEGIGAPEASAALTRISHMVNLFRYRGMFDLPDRAATSDTLAIAMQRMLFPEATAGPAPQPQIDRTSTPPAPSHATPPPTLSDNLFTDDVLSASSHLFAERGYHAVSVDDIAAAVGISRATLYRNFSSKTRILAELTSVATTHTEALAAELQEVVNAGLDPARLQDWMTRYVAFHRRYNGVIRAWFDGAVAEQLTKAGVQHGIEALRGAVESVLDSVVLPEGVNPQACTAIFMAALGRMTEPIEHGAGAEQPDRAATLLVLILQRAMLGLGATSTAREQS